MTHPFNLFSSVLSLIAVTVLITSPYSEWNSIRLGALAVNAFLCGVNIVLAFN